MRDGRRDEVAHELADVVHVADGTALACGTDLDAVPAAEVHRADVTELGDDGRPVVGGDGKVVEGARFEEPDVAAVLCAQGWAGRRRRLAALVFPQADRAAGRGSSGRY